MPLAELHLHIEGTLEADLLVTLAPQRRPLPSNDPAELTARYANFADLQAFLDVYYANLAVLRTDRTSPTWPRPTWAGPGPPGAARGDLLRSADASGQRRPLEVGSAAWARPLRRRDARVCRAT